MDILITVAFFGWLQTISTISHHRWKWMGLVMALIGGGLCYAMHPWVAGFNFARINEVLATPAGLTSLATLLFIEASLKGLERFHEPQTHGHQPFRSGWHRAQSLWVVGIAGCIRYSPPLTLVFAVFYAQLFAFHEIESLSFSSISLRVAAAFAALIGIGSYALRFRVSDETRRLLEYRLLFLQLTVALLLPVTGRIGRSVPIFHGPDIYLRFGVFMGILLFVFLVGYAGYRVRQRRHLLSP